ncbi:universal stress protein [Streptomyces sp. NPDC085900]|uniref:universal stress protein n=1 Tax=Streptomyces sp. NPDC085900 TaxID=3365737 RepID=UPI0037D6954C
MGRVVVVGDDDSAAGRAAVAWAEREARLRGLTLSSDDLAEPHRVGGDVELLVRPSPAADAGGAPAAVSGRPVVFVPATSARLPGRVAVGVDARDPAEAAIGFAFESARLRGAGLHAVHAWTLPAEAADRPFAVPEADRATWEDQEVQLLSDALRPWRARYPEVEVVPDVLAFPPPQALTHASTTAGLLVLGHRTGRTASAVLGRVRCAVAVVAG